MTGRFAEGEISPDGVERVIDEYVSLAASHKRAIKAGLSYGEALLDLSARKKPPTQQELSDLGVKIIHEMKEIWDDGLGKLAKNINEK